MLFHTQLFILFFAVLFALHWLARSSNSRHWILLAASLAFYMVWSVPLVSLLLISSVLDFYVGQKVWQTRDKRWVVLSLSVNLGILAFFKYANFGIQSFVATANALGLHLSPVTLDIVLPLGISFYTFQSMSYTIDMYRRKYEPYRSARDFALFVSFFPQLIAGPIVRADYFAKQLQRKTPLRWVHVNQGIALFIIGVFKKVALADQAAPFANAVFGAPTEYTSFMAIIGVLAFSFQIYFDFSAYTDMARGLGYMLGYKLPENFTHPYGALGLREFWRKWHISLSTWLRDYLYIPLGGSRGSAWKTRRNLMLTMFLGGLWHGAGWNFAIWGCIHGLCLGLEEKFSKKRSLRSDSLVANVFIGFATYALVCFAWIFFRAQTFSDAMQVLAAIFTIPSGSLLHQVQLFNIQNWALGIILPAAIVFRSAYKPFDKTLLSYPLVVAVTVVALMLLLSALISGGASEFIYFQF